jgi:hypothetical protein
LHKILVVLLFLCTALLAQTRKVTITAPHSYNVYQSPVRIMASATTTYTAVTAMQAFIDGTLVYSNSNVATLSATLALAPGFHTLVVKAWDGGGRNLYQATASFTVLMPPTLTPAPTMLFADNFESNNFSRWSVVNKSPDVTVIRDPSTFGNMAQIHYYICGDALNPVCGASHQDNNRWFEKDFNSTNGFPEGLDHFVVKGDVYLKAPEPGASSTIQRKLLRFKAPWGPGGLPNSYFNGTLTSFASSSSTGRSTLVLSCESSLRITAGMPAGCGEKGSMWTAAVLDYNRWYTLQFEMKLNTPGKADGYMRLWVNGVIVGEKIGLYWRTATYMMGVTRLEFGEQVDRLNFVPVNEYRYWRRLQIGAY